MLRICYIIAYNCIDKKIMRKFIILIITLYTMILNAQNTIYEISLQDIDNNSINLSEFKGKYILFVNVASYCGYTNQYADLQKLHEKYDNLEVVGLPCNQFLFQDEHPTSF